MAFDFDRFLREDPPQSAACPEQRPTIVLHTPPQHQMERIEAVPQLVYGEDVHSNPVPTQTAKGLSGLYALFEDTQGRRFGLNQELLSKHLLLLGGIGSGKTNVFNFLLEELLAKQSPDDVIFIFDTKGDYQRAFYHSYDPNHLIIGNSGGYANRTCFWNIFGELENADGSFGSAGEFTAKEIAKQLFEGRGSDMQPFFALAAADLVGKLLMDFERRAQRSGDRSQLNNEALAGWLRSANLGAYFDLLQRNPDFSSASLYIGDPALGAKQNLSPQALAVFGYINAMHNDLFTGIFARHDPSRAFSMRKLVRDRGRNGGRTVVFIEYDLSVGEVLAPMYRLLIDLALKEALGQDRTRRGNVIFVIDEFKLLPNLMHIDDALNFGRGLGIKVFAGLQSIDQVYANYGEDRGKAILSGFMNSFCFQTPDYNSRRYIVERFGENCTQLVYRSLNEPFSQQREGHAVEDWDVLSLGIGHAVVDLVGQKPFLFQFQDFEQPHQVL